MAYLICSCEQSKPEIFELKQYTSVDNNNLSEVFLIKNPPKDSSDMIRVLRDFHIKNGRIKKYTSHSRLYIQKRDLYELEKLILKRSDKLPNKTFDLRNEDFLVKYFWYSAPNGHSRCRRTIYHDRW